MARANGQRNKKGGAKKSYSEANEIAQLDAAIVASAPAAGTSSVSAFDRPTPGTMLVTRCSVGAGYKLVTQSAVC